MNVNEHQRDDFTSNADLHFTVRDFNNEHNSYLKLVLNSYLPFCR